MIRIEHALSNVGWFLLVGGVVVAGVIAFAARISSNLSALKYCLPFLAIALGGVSIHLGTQNMAVESTVAIFGAILIGGVGFVLIMRPSTPEEPVEPVESDS